MPGLELPLDLLSRISPNGLRAYARAKGWERVKRAKGDYAVFSWPKGDLDQILVPGSSSTDDFSARVTDAVLGIARIEQRPPQHVLFDIVNQDSDVVRVRVSGDGAAVSLPLVDAVTMFDGVQRTLLAAAHSVLEPQRYHPRLSRSDAEQLVRACRFEQTERGSFVVAISCPLRAVDAPPAKRFGQEDSFTRRTTKYLCNSLLRLFRLIRDDMVRDVLEERDDAPLLSANLCDALLRLRPESRNAAVEYSFSWATSLPLNDAQVTSPSTVRFEQDDFDGIEDAYIYLRPESQPESATFVAMVDELRGTLDEDEQRQGEVTLSLYSRESDEIIKAKADLVREWYVVAADAHMHARYVLVSGLLNRARRRSHLAEIKQFELLPEDGPGSSSDVLDQ